MKDSPCPPPPFLTLLVLSTPEYFFSSSNSSAIVTIQFILTLCAAAAATGMWTELPSSFLPPAACRIHNCSPFYCSTIPEIPPAPHTLRSGKMNEGMTCCVMLFVTEKQTAGYSASVLKHSPQEMPAILGRESSHGRGTNPIHVRSMAREKLGIQSTRKRYLSTRWGLYPWKVVVHTQRLRLPQTS